MLSDMKRRLSVNNQYIEVVIEESDQGRPDLIAKRVYGSTDWTWLIFKFASLKTMSQTVTAGTVLKLPSIPNVLAALKRERAEGIPVFSYFSSQSEIDGIQADSQGGSGATKSLDDIFEANITETAYLGQPVIMGSSGSVELAENDGVHYKVVGIMSNSVSAGQKANYLTRGEITISNWSTLLDSGESMPEANKLIWLAETGRGMLSLTSAQSSGKHAVRIGTTRAGGVLFVDIGQPIGL